MRALLTKNGETVFVPAYPGKTVFEGYTGVPASDFAQEAKKKLESFLDETSCTYSIRTLNGTLKGFRDLVVGGDDHGVLVNGTVIHPTKFGIDKVAGQPRFWLFDDRTLAELDVVCQYGRN